MLNFLKTLSVFLVLGRNNTTHAQVDIHQPIPGSQTDGHGCVIDGGYQWCESTQQCQRTWELPCETMNSDFCETTKPKTCRMRCPEPSCPSTQCSMRIDDCCEFMCIDIPKTDPPIVCSNACPPVPMCPMPPMMANNCDVVPGVTDHCGCDIGCPSIDCSTRSQNIVPEGSTCGGYMPYGMAGICDDGLECVYTMDPMVADAPGTCMPSCHTSRDYHGNCISSTVPPIPYNCMTWYDGCNTCSSVNGDLHGCTMMMCFTQTEPYCQTFTSGDLMVGEICHRFCEDSSQNTINRQKDCPGGTECVGSGVSYDSCGSSAHTCTLISGH
jgi:hypothetical protein